ncbi:MAG TPA: sigma-70 family RNA polymerase sigma factor [Pirellulaceae bacterium]|nr:sigma-70 family RNA polymerase sigma factor [Pirellulaceae bacterium]HMO94384.1 sigma-70 family RNA polymerase sigma factor [Pirellulaceae bacterium]HMP78746.1 sigma-70 family RNA polymerase sigma factor [Pirellulaceae bacterium]
MSEISRLLEQAREGDKSIQDALLTLVYDELRRMAAAKIRQQPPAITLGATALVHEAWMRLAPNNQMPAWNCRGHFFAAAAEAMRRVLIDAARRRKSLKRGGNQHRVELESVQSLDLPDERLLELDEALARLEQEKPDVARLVKLRYFVGLKIDEAAEIMEISPRTAKNWWAFARAWLHDALAEE